MRILLCTVFSMVLFGQTAVRGDIILSLDGCNPDPCGTDCGPLGQFPALNCWTSATAVQSTAVSAHCRIDVALLHDSHFGRRVKAVDAAFVVTRGRLTSEVFRCPTTGLALSPHEAARATWSWQAEKGSDVKALVVERLEELLATHGNRVSLVGNVVSRTSVGGVEGLLLSFRRFGGSREYQAFVLVRCGAADCQVASVGYAPGGFFGFSNGVGAGPGTGTGIGAAGLGLGLGFGLGQIGSGGGNNGSHRPGHTHDPTPGKPGGHPHNPEMPGKPWPKPEKPYCPPPMGKPGGGVTAVPEPSSLALLSVAGAGLVFRRFRKKRS